MHKRRKLATGFKLLKQQVHQCLSLPLLTMWHTKPPRRSSKASSKQEEGGRGWESLHSKMLGNSWLQHLQLWHPLIFFPWIIPEAERNRAPTQGGNGSPVPTLFHYTPPTSASFCQITYPTTTLLPSTILTTDL